MELGARPTDNMFLTLNVFDITITDPIIYFYYSDNDGNDVEWYENQERSGSTGFELEYRIKYGWGYGNVTYSYANPHITDKFDFFDKNKVPSYEVPGKENMVLGLPQHKLTLNGCWLRGSLSINPSLIYISQRFGSFGNGIIDKEKPSLITNIFVQYKNLLTNNLTAGIGVYNILGQKYDYLQPYYVVDSDLPPHPGPSREFTLKLSYDLGL